MCISLFRPPTPPDPPPLPPATKPNPIVAPPKPMVRKLIEPETMAKVQYGADKDKSKKPRKQMAADSLKINIGGDNPAAASGGLNVS